MYVTLQMNIKHRKHTTFGKAKSYRCLNNKNSIVSDNLDRNYTVSNKLDQPLQQD